MKIKFENYLKPEYIRVFNEYVDLKGIQDQWELLSNLAYLECLEDGWDKTLDSELNSALGINFKLESDLEISGLTKNSEYTIEQPDGSNHLTLVAEDRTSKDLAMREFDNKSKIYYVLPYKRMDFSPNIRLLADVILSDAKRLRSTDVHFVIESDLEEGFNYKVKFRRGLYLEEQPKFKLTKVIIDDIINDFMINRSAVGQKFSELSILSGVRFRLVDKRFPSRCQVARSIGGKTLTIRSFDFGKAPSIEKLGFNKATQDMLYRTASTYSGLTLVSGVFGSGKGTTLNAVGMIMEEKGNTAIASLDDPIEYLRKYNQYEYFNETQLQEYVEAFKKMDLNAVFLNEIITGFVADAVYNLISAGVHVLSTIHTNRVFRVMYKLEELLKDDYLNIIPFLNVISYQDKFSITCKGCQNGIAKNYYAAGSDEDKLLTFLNLDTIRQPKGCSNCNKGIINTGIKVVSEHIEFTDKIKQDLLRLDIHQQFEYLKTINSEGENLEDVVRQALIEGDILLEEAIVKLDTWR